MKRVLTKIEKERYIALLDEDYAINYLKSIINEKWFLEFVYDDDFNKCKAYIYAESKRFDDELSMIGFLQVLYARNKYELVEQAKDYQLLFANGVRMGWGDIAYFSNYFEKLGKRFGCLREFRENGII